MYGEDRCSTATLLRRCALCAARWAAPRFWFTVQALQARPALHIFSCLDLVVLPLLVEICVVKTCVQALVHCAAVRCAVCAAHWAAFRFWFIVQQARPHSARILLAGAGGGAAALFESMCA